MARTFPAERGAAFLSTHPPQHDGLHIGAVLVAIGALIALVLVVGFLSVAAQTFHGEVTANLSLPSFQGLPPTHEAAPETPPVPGR